MGEVEAGVEQGRVGVLKREAVVDQLLSGPADRWSQSVQPADMMLRRGGRQSVVGHGRYHPATASSSPPRCQKTVFRSGTPCCSPWIHSGAPRDLAVYTCQTSVPAVVA